ncbi:MAG: dihydrofolate reductase [Patescibacteria group bacterium]
MLTLIAAVSKNGCIGKDGTLPWRIPEDLKHFRQLTVGKVVIMGRKTWESIPEKFRPLPDRTNVVVTRQAGYAVPEGVKTYPSVIEALTWHAGDNVVVIGGAEIYTQTIGNADRLEITEVDQVVDGDAFFPAIETPPWQEIAREQHNGFAFVTYERQR